MNLRLLALFVLTAGLSPAANHAAAEPASAHEPATKQDAPAHHAPAAPATETHTSPSAETPAAHHAHSADPHASPSADAPPAPAAAESHAAPPAASARAAEKSSAPSSSHDAPAAAAPAHATEPTPPANAAHTHAAHDVSPPAPHVAAPAHKEPSAHPDAHAPSQPATAHASTEAHGAAAPKTGHDHVAPENDPLSGGHPPGVLPARPEEIVSLLRIGQTKLDKGDFTSAEIAFRQILLERATIDQDREALLGLARTYRKKGDFTKASAVYEKLVKEFPADPNLPTIYLELGRTLRALSAPKQAIARFYSVINTTLKMPEAGPEHYRQLARTAQFEIAETYFQMGDYEQANRFFSRLKLLDLAPEDRARAHFKSAYALTLAGTHDKAVPALKTFIEINPDDENIPEARYLLALSLRQLGQSNEALTVALDLLRVEQARTRKDPKRWSYWQRKTGNQLANAFYERGEFNHALLIYESLSRLSPEPAWRLPVTYQIALCHERLQMYERARESYQSIVDNAKAPSTDGASRTALGDLADMAAWRLDQLSWLQTTEKQLTQIFPAEHYPSAFSTTAPSPAAHDVHGSAAKSPEPL